MERPPYIDVEVSDAADPIIPQHPQPEWPEPIISAEDLDGSYDRVGGADRIL